ncbi:hypothetical protein MYX07_02230, partial [Patescibacteria group bacterium AH-259-L07]|nr:hypothetical protein [Patescibacteria group bacterium AH-259-L07]
IDPAVMRPGRTSRVLVYDLPRDASERREIIQIYLDEYGIEIDDLEEAAKKVDELTGDEIRQVFWSLKFEEKTKATINDIKSKIKEITRKRELYSAGFEGSPED